jgi:hypothetical protein
VSRSEAEEYVRSCGEDEGPESYEEPESYRDVPRVP